MFGHVCKWRRKVKCVRQHFCGNFWGFICTPSKEHLAAHGTCQTWQPAMLFSGWHFGRNQCELGPQPNEGGVLGSWADAEERVVLFHHDWHFLRSKHCDVGYSRLWTFLKGMFCHADPVLDPTTAIWCALSVERWGQELEAGGQHPSWYVWGSLEATLDSLAAQ